MQKTTYGFDQSAGVPMMAIHTFETSPAGELVHLIDGKLRATVPPEGWSDYAKSWPDAVDVIDALRIVPAAPAAPATPALDVMLDQAAQIAALKAQVAALQPAQEQNNEVAS